MKVFRMIYGLCGLCLLAGMLLTGSYGLSKANREVYHNAISLQSGMDKMGISDFKLTDYKVRFYDGEHDYVLYDGDVKKEAPVFSTFVGTTYKIDGEYQVILPTVENFKEMFDLLGTANSIANGKSTLEHSTYGIGEHVATLWHEAFHAYQFTNYEAQIQKIVLKSDKLAESSMENILVNYVDSNKNVVKLFCQEMELLQKAYDSKDLVNKKTYITEYLKLDQKRTSMLEKDVLSMEMYYEMVEGTACYVETYAYYLQKGGKAFESEYLGKFEYSDGTGKYYKMGMLKCWLLSQMDAKWIEEYDFSKSLDALLNQMLDGV